MIKRWITGVLAIPARFGAVALLNLTLLYCSNVNSAVLSVLILPSADEPSYQAVISRLSHHLSGADLRLHIARADEPLIPSNLQQFDLAVTIGTKATQRLLDQPLQIPLLSTFIPKATFEAITAKQRPQIAQGRLTALYLEQPLSRQLDLLALVKPETQSLGTLLGPNSADLQHLLESAAKQKDWQIQLDTMASDDNPTRILTPLISASDAFLVVPDKSVFNRNTARWILLMTLRQRIPLIAYSKRYVDAGALAAVHSTTTTVGDETALWIKHWLRFQKLPAPSYPKLFEVSTNPQTARTLRLDLPSPETLAEALQGADSP